MNGVHYRCAATNSDAQTRTPAARAIVARNGIKLFCRNKPRRTTVNIWPQLRSRRSDDNEEDDSDNGADGEREREGTAVVQMAAN